MTTPIRVSQNWRGENIDAKRPVIRLECDKDVPCHGITLDNVNLWTESGDAVSWSCQNAYGSGACLRDAGSAKKLATYQAVITVAKKP
jgi:rhamnogalacturonan hydrolase